jgi:hypothetical protein
MAGREVDTDAVRLLCDLAPRLNSAILDDDESNKFTLDLEKSASDLFDCLLNEPPPNSESLGRYLELSLYSDRRLAVSLLVFVCTAAFETTIGLVQLCQGVAHLHPRPTTADLLSWANPVPFFVYSTSSDIQIGPTQIPGDSIVALCTSTDTDVRPSLAFGFGSHFCFGARITMGMGNILLSELPERDVGELEWDCVAFTRSLRKTIVRSDI